MLNFHLKLTTTQQNDLANQLKMAEAKGDSREAKRIMAILALGSGQDKDTVARVLCVTVKSIYHWVRQFLLNGVRGLRSKKSPGRPSKLTKSQRRQLAELIEAGPEKAGFVGNCWHSPMIQQLILEQFGVSFSVHYISQLLKNMGFSYQKAKFVSDHLNEAKREEWLAKTWSTILALAKEKNAYLLFGDEASFPQWG